MFALNCYLALGSMFSFITIYAILKYPEWFISKGMDRREMEQIHDTLRLPTAGIFIFVMLTVGWLPLLFMPSKKSKE